MKNTFKTGKHSIAVILTLCILLGIAGTCVYAASVMPEENTAVTEETTQELVPLAASTCNETNNDYMMFTMSQVAAQNGWTIGSLNNGHATIMQGGVVIGRYDQYTAGFWGPHFHLYRNTTNIHYTLSGY